MVANNSYSLPFSVSTVAEFFHYIRLFIQRESKAHAVLAKVNVLCANLDTVLVPHT